MAKGKRQDKTKSTNQLPAKKETGQVASGSDKVKNKEDPPKEKPKDKPGAKPVEELGYKEGPEFSKRKLRSNWSKYEAPIVDEDPELDPTDFDYVLSLSTGTRLKLGEEKSFSSDVDNVEALQLDFAELASSFECIPLYKRLKISPNTFKETQLNEFDIAAKKKVANYKPRKEKIVISKTDERKEQELIARLSVAQYKSEGPKLQGLGDHQFNFSDVSPLEQELISDPESGQSDEDDQMEELHSDQTVSQSTKEEELDSFLASVEKPEQVPTPTLEFTVKSEEVKDDDKKEVFQPNLGTETTESLEDWLDSVLND